MRTRCSIYRVLALGVALIVTPFTLSGCAEMQSMGVTDSLVKTLTSQLNVTSDQATGGVGSMLSLARKKLSGMDFNALTNMIPGTDTYMKAAKDLGAVIGPVGGKEGLTSSFSKLGMGSDMVGKFSGVLSDFVGKVGGNRLRTFWPLHLDKRFDAGELSWQWPGSQTLPARTGR